MIQARSNRVPTLSLPRADCVAIPFMVREPHHERNCFAVNSSSSPFVLRLSKGERPIATQSLAGEGEGNSEDATLTFILSLQRRARKLLFHPAANNLSDVVSRDPIAFLLGFQLAQARWPLPRRSNCRSSPASPTALHSFPRFPSAFSE